MDDIIREYPPSPKDMHNDRYTTRDFDKYKTLSRENYDKLIQCINYNTNRKIGYRGKIYNKLYSDFIIRGKLFTNMDGIDCDEYLNETEKLKKEYNNRQKIIWGIQNKIDKLNEDEYITFEGKKYGRRPKIIFKKTEHIHYENDCLGVFDYIYDGCSCSSCENWFGCTNPTYTMYYTCKKCGYKYSETKQGGRNYKGK